MSEDYINIIPTNPEYVPDASAYERATALLTSLLPNPTLSTEVTAILTEHVEFVDQGENFERIVCPVCSSELSTEWWGEAMDKAHERHFADLGITTPCCHTETSLNDLKYEWPAGFARFVIELFEPFSIDAEGVYQMLELSQDTLNRLQEILGCDLRVIWAHY